MFHFGRKIIGKLKTDYEPQFLNQCQSCARSPEDKWNQSESKYS